MIAERMIAMYVAILTFRDREEGQTAVEYALILALVAIVLATALATGLTNALDPTISKITKALGATT